MGLPMLWQVVIYLKLVREYLSAFNAYLATLIFLCRILRANAVSLLDNRVKSHIFLCAYLTFNWGA